VNTITITTSLPHAVLNPNRQKRSGRFARWKAAEKNKAKGGAYLAAVVASKNTRLMWERATVQVTFYLRDRRGLDADQDNRIASIKGVMDGIAEAGIVANDRGLTWLPVRHEVDKVNPRLEITITELTATP
jgi:Holliday junction resolvase RusA-like endonuclease